MRGWNGSGRRSLRSTVVTRARLLLLALAGLVVIAGCTAPSDGSGSGSDQGSSSPSGKPAALTLVPAANAGDVAPGEPVTVGVADGKINEVKLVGADGTQVEGKAKEDGTGWESTQGLGYGKSYTVTATATGTDGKPVTSSSTFTTVGKPARQASVSINVAEGETVGVGLPLIFTFSSKITDKVAAENALKIVTEPQTVGAFHWFSDSSVIWRPQEYWKSGTKISINAKIYGKNLGNGTFGKEDKAVNLTVGDKLVAVADGGNYQMKVSINDQEAKTMPISMGKKSSPTPSGTYTVMSEHVGYTMDSSTYGVPADSKAGYRTFVKYAVRMSNSGIFYHSAPWSVGSQGKRNVSHGCINLSTENAKWLMDTSKKGDIITVQNSGGKALHATDGWSVWQMSWEDWKAGAAKK